MTTPDELHARALALLLKGDTAGAISDLKAYVGEEPDDETAWLELGTAYAAIEHWPDAARCLGRAVELDGDVVQARLGFARALVRMGKLDDAAFQLLQAAKVDPADARVAKELGLVFYDKRLYDKAAQWLAKAAAAAPADGRAAYALGLAHEARRDVGAAIAAYREAIRRDPALVDAHKTLADALASIGEHEQAIAALEALLAIDRNNEQAAHNREVLARALDEMRARRLLGKPEQAFEESALVQEGQLKRKGKVPAERPGTEVVRWAAPLAEVWLTLGEASRAIEAAMLILSHPERAAAEPDDVFKVTVIAQDGRREPVQYATAITLTFLREALGCPMTHASELYAKLLAGEPEVDWGGARLRFASVPRPDKPADTRHGILITPR